MNHFTIEIPCKSYVKVYLETNCGTPVDLVHLPDLQLLVIRNLKKKQDYRKTDPICNYEDKITAVISPKIFYRYGWEITKEGIREINSFSEKKIKFIMRQYIFINSKLGQPVASCIRDFQQIFLFPEDVWSYESIKKDYDRHIRSNDMPKMKDLKKEINKILLSNLSELGTISKLLLKQLCDE